MSVGDVEEANQLVGVEANGRGVVRDLGPAHVGHGGEGEHVDADAVVVELRDAAEPPGDRCRRHGLSGAGSGSLVSTRTQASTWWRRASKGCTPTAAHQEPHALRSER